MKPINCILGPMAVILGLGLSKTAGVLAQETTVEVQVAAPAAAPVKIPVAASKAAAAATAAAPVLAPILIWDSQSADSALIGAWGNGAIARNGNTLTATVRNLDEGVRFDPKKPVDIAAFRRAGWWRVRVQLPNAQAARGRGRRTPNNAATAGVAAPLTQLRLKLMLDKGAMSGVIPINANQRGNDFQSLLLAVRNMTATRGASGAVRRIILTGDSTASFGIEQVALVSESNRITATVRRSTDAAGTDLKDVTLKPGRGATLVADVDGGTSDLLVQWNFNADNSPALPPPAAAGAARGARNPGARAGAPGAPIRRIDATGTSVRPNWPNEEEDYRVEVTISDRAGRKPAIKKSFAVKIRRFAVGAG